MSFDFKKCFVQSVGILVAGVPILGIVAARGDGASHRFNAPLVVGDPRAVLIKSRRLLYLYDSDRLVRTYPVELGYEPIGTKGEDGDGRTPEGSFRVVRINAESRYRRFLGIDYPNRPAVQAGLASGALSAGEAAAILDALGRGVAPSAWTPLGGGIGLHGGGGRGYDWTAGCVALSDEHIEELYQVLRIGDPIEILP